MLPQCCILPLQPDSSTMPMQSKLTALNLFCKAMLSTGLHESDPDANLFISDEARRLARQDGCALAPSIRLAARSFSWIRLLSQEAQPNLPLLAAAEIASLESDRPVPSHVSHYAAERRSMTLQMILETVHIYTAEEVMEPDDFKLSALIVSQTIHNLGMDRRVEQDIINGAAQHLRWIFPGISTRVMNGMPICLFPSEGSQWPHEEASNPYAGLEDDNALGILDRCRNSDAQTRLPDLQDPSNGEGTGSCGQGNRYKRRHSAAGVLGYLAPRPSPGTPFLR